MQILPDTPYPHDFYADGNELGDLASLVRGHWPNDVAQALERSWQVSYPYEADFQAEVIRWARAYGWDVYHVPNSVWTTPPYGFPDLHLTHTSYREPSRGIIYAELKVHSALEGHQYRYLVNLAKAGAEVHLWNPQDWPHIWHILSGRPLLYCSIDKHMLYEPGVRGAMIADHYRDHHRLNDADLASRLAHDWHMADPSGTCWRQFLRYLPVVRDRTTGVRMQQIWDEANALMGGEPDRKKINGLSYESLWNRIQEELHWGKTADIPAPCTRSFCEERSICSCSSKGWWQRRLVTGTPRFKDPLSEYRPLPRPLKQQDLKPELWGLGYQQETE